MLNCGFCQIGAFCVMRNLFGACGLITRCLKSRKGERKDIEAVYASPERLESILCTRAWNTTCLLPSCLQRSTQRIGAANGDIVDVTELVD